MVRNIEFERKVGPKGQIVIPNEIRKAVGVKPESKVYVTLEKERIIIRPRKGSIEDFLSIIPKEKRKKLKVKNLDRWHEEELEERWERSKSGLSRR